MDNEIIETDGVVGPPVTVIIKKKPKIYTIYNIDIVLERADLAVAGWKADPDIQSAMARFNYNAARIEKIETQLGVTRTAIVESQSGRASYRTLVDESEASQRIARTAAADLSTAARLELTAAERETLGLTKGIAPYAVPAFLLYADKLFDGALSAPPEIKAKLAEVGYDDQQLLREREKITNFRSAHAAAVQAKGTAQDLTPTQKDALDSLDSEVMKLRIYARRALKERPQLLEKIGIKAK